METALDMTLIIVALIALVQGVSVAIIQRTRKQFAADQKRSSNEDRVHHSAIEWKLDQIGHEIKGVKTDITQLRERFDTHIDGSNH